MSTAQLSPVADPASGRLLTVRLPSTPSSVQGTLALEFEPILDPPELVEPIKPIKAPGTPASDRVAVPPEWRHRLEQWTRRHLQAVVEVAAGDRPGAQVAHWCSRDVHLDLARRAMLPGQRRRHRVRPLVLSVRLQVVDTDAFEACAHVRYGPRSRAVAARYEQFRGRWRAVAPEFA